ncbi:MAG: hypothetical protein ABGZ53_37025 [Fuerstiella sp.]
MRSLIRPTLFLVARVGLVLSVGFWIVGQWWEVLVQMSLAAGAIHKEGWVCAAIYPGPAGWVVSTNEADNGESAAWLFQYPSFDRATGEPSGFSFIGLTALHFPHMFATVALRHWLTTTFFALFYGVLKWVYRKRRKAVADE